MANKRLKCDCCQSVVAVEKCKSSARCAKGHYCQLCILDFQYLINSRYKINVIEQSIKQGMGWKVVLFSHLLRKKAIAND
jgi:hypothetical protein